MPTPEPITRPSIRETVGLVKQSRRQLSAYSAASEARAFGFEVRPQLGHLAQIPAGAKGPGGG